MITGPEVKAESQIVLTMPKAVATKLHEWLEASVGLNDSHSQLGREPLVDDLRKVMVALQEALKQ